MNAEVTALDLFSGCGGTTEGGEQAGVNVVWAANHNPEAVRIHKLNHPKTETVCQDLRQANFTQVPRVKLVYASPECQGHARSRGKERPHHDESRATAYAVLSCVEVVLPDIIIVENVPEFRKWGPKDRATGKTQEGKKGLYFGLWKKNLQIAGYRLSENIIDAADCGVAQHRERLFVVGVHSDIVDRPVYVKQPQMERPSASTIIDYNLPIKKIGSWLVPNTLKKIRHGRMLFGNEFLVQYNGNSGPQPLDKPLGSVTTKDRFGIVLGDSYRMLEIHEYKAAMGFRPSYQLPSVKSLALKMLGNAVVPAVAKWVTESVLKQVYSPSNKKRAA